MSINYNQCIYMNAEKQNAEVMLEPCINGSQSLVWPCVQRETIDKDIFSLITERPLGDNTTKQLNHSLLDDLNNVKTTIKNIEASTTTDGNNGIEGFTNMGEHYVRPGDCPDGYQRCPLTGRCMQVCINCKYNERTYDKSKIFNEADPCFPDQGVYAGIDNQGNTLCTCGQKNEYCGDNFNTQGGLFADNMFIMNVGDYSSVVNLANY